MVKALAAAVSVLALVSAIAGALALRPRVAPSAGAVPGLRVAGATLAAGEDIRAHVQARARALEQRRVTLRVQGTDRVVERSLAQLGVRLDVEEMVRRAEAIGRHGHLAVRIDELRRARRGEIELPLAVRVDPQRVAELVLPLKDDADQAPRPARFDLKTREIVAHTPGRYLDLDATVAALHALALSSESELEAPRRPIAPRVDAKLLASTRIDVVLSEFVTHFAPSPNRGTNIAVAAGRLDGIVLAPDELVSFNDAVGARTEDNGFRPAPEIYKGEMVQGIGGGTCQVSSTLHAAALHAGLDIVERYPHSRPSEYIALGLDSTVSWPTVDLKLRNPWPFPVVVHTIVERGTLRVQLLGQDKPATITLARDTLAVRPFKRKVTESSWLEPGTVIQKQKGIRGYSIRKTRVITLAGGVRRTETVVDHYPATPQHLVVAPGTDEADLPPLPEGAANPSDEHAAAQPASGASSS